MYYVDYHMHSSHSPDCDESPENQILAAISKGLDEICFTDHIELGFSDWNYREMDIDRYIHDIRAFQEKYKQIKIKIGAEIGISCSDRDLDRTIEAVNSHSFDFVIASAHRIKNINVFNPSFYEGDGFQDFCKKYIVVLLQSLEKTSDLVYNSIGHIDLPIKPACRIIPDFPYKEFKYEYTASEIDELLKYIISHGKCPEINTASWMLPNGAVPECKWLKRYAELGGQYVTIGSDAHNKQTVGNNFDKAVDLARSSGIKYLAVYNKMEPEFISL